MKKFQHFIEQSSDDLTLFDEEIRTSHQDEFHFRTWIRIKIKAISRGSYGELKANFRVSAYKVSQKRAIWLHGLAKKQILKKKPPCFVFPLWLMAKIKRPIGQ